MKQVRETAAGRSISAFVILKKGKEVATVQMHHSNGGTVTVDIWNGNNKIQQSRAGGGGYDKKVAAMQGMTVDGIVLNDHCGEDKRTERIFKAYTEGKLSQEQAESKAKRIGANFANYRGGKFTSLHLAGGLDKLSLLGYTVIQAI